MAKWMGVSRGMGMVFPEWGEDVIRRGIRAGQGFPVEEGWGGQEESMDEDTPRGDNSDVYGFGFVETQTYGAYLGRSEYDCDDPDSDGFSEAEWDGWAYDLDRAQVADDVLARFGSRKAWRNGMTSRQASAVRDSQQCFGTVGGVDSFAIDRMGPRARKFTAGRRIEAMMQVSGSSDWQCCGWTATLGGTRMGA